MGACESKNNLELISDLNVSNQNSSYQVFAQQNKASNFSNINNNNINMIPNKIIKEEDNNQNMKQVSIKEGADFITNGALISSYDLENEHHYIYISGSQKLIGPPLYPKTFIPPIGWTAIALKVSKKYDNGDDKWLGNSNLNGEWYIGYHGIKTMSSIHEI